MTRRESDAIDELVETIKRERGGVVHCATGEVTAPGVTPRQSIDSFVGRYKLAGIGDAWVEVSQDVAQQHLAEVLHRGLAYNGELIPRQRAAELASAFLAMFPGGRYFTNTEDAPYDAKQSSHGWDPITQATFDTGIVALRGNEIGMIWLEDED